MDIIPKEEFAAIHNRLEAMKKKQYDESPVGKIEIQLRERAKKQGVGSEVIHGNVSEIFIFDNQKARLHVTMAQATVGESQGNLQYVAESHEYKHFPWWKETIEPFIGAEIRLLDPTLAMVAEDAHIPPAIFDPDIVVTTHHLTELFSIQEEAVQVVKRIIIRTLGDQLGQDYKISDTAHIPGGMRMVATSEVGRQSLVKDNAAYNKAVEILSHSRDILEAAYKTGGIIMAELRISEHLTSGDETSNKVDIQRAQSVVQRWMSGIDAMPTKLNPAAIERHTGKLGRIRARLSILAIRAPYNETTECTIWDGIRYSMPEDKWRTIPESAKTIFEHPLQGDPTVILSQTGLIRPDEELYKSMSAVISTFTPQELAIYNAIHPISVL